MPARCSSPPQRAILIMAIVVVPVIMAVMVVPITMVMVPPIIVMMMVVPMMMPPVAMILSLHDGWTFACRDGFQRGHVAAERRSLGAGCGEADPKRECHC
jgi:hypothetical protein